MKNFIVNVYSGVFGLWLGWHVIGPLSCDMIDMMRQGAACLGRARELHLREPTMDRVPGVRGLATSTKTG